jgi:hypothetical protein
VTRLFPSDAGRRAALAWAGLALVAVLALSLRARLGPDEARLATAAARHGAWWTGLPAHPQGSLSGVDAALGPEAGAASLPLAVAGMGHELVGRHVGGLELLSLRFGAALFAALLAWLLSRFGEELAGTGGALLAPALLFLVPAALSASVAVGTALPAAALWLGVLLAQHRLLHARDRRERTRRALVAGLLFGAAVASRRDAWALLPLLAVHYLAVRARGPIRAHGDGLDHPPHHPAGRSGWRSLLAGLPPSVPALVLLGPLVLAALTPWLWPEPIGRALPVLRAAIPASPFVHLGRLVSGAAPWHAPVLAAFLLPPAAVALLYLAGIAHAGRRLVLGWRGEAACSFPDELLLLLGAIVPVLLAATGAAPAEAGIGPVLPALPILALLGARALLSAAKSAWPAGAAKLAVAIALVALYPAARATVRTFPHGAGAWGEQVGGAPGAASLGLPRVASGAGAALLGELRDRAAAGQRLYWPSLPPPVLEALRRDGRIRPDLRLVATPEEADLALVEHDEAQRDVEFRVWTAFESARPVAVETLDEVPLASLYARPGAWR